MLTLYVRNEIVWLQRYRGSLLRARCDCSPRPANPRQFPRKPDYKSPEERYRDNMNIIFGDYEEVALSAPPRRVGASA